MDTIIVAVALQILLFLVVAFYFVGRFRRLSAIESRLLTIQREVEALVSEFGSASSTAIGRLEARLDEVRSVLVEGDPPAATSRARASATTDHRTHRSTAQHLPAALRYQPPASQDRPSERSSTLPASDDATRPTRDAEKPYSASGGSAGNSPAFIEPAPIAFSLGKSASDPPLASPLRGSRDEALDLHRAGFSSDVIAAKLGMSVSEVELIAGLGERRGR